jgi:hypothetical protein
MAFASMRRPTSARNIPKTNAQHERRLVTFVECLPFGISWKIEIQANRLAMRSRLRGSEEKSRVTLLVVRFNGCHMGLK